MSPRTIGKKRCRPRPPRPWVPAAPRKPARDSRSAGASDLDASCSFGPRRQPGRYSRGSQIRHEAHGGDAHMRRRIRRHVLMKRRQGKPPIAADPWTPGSARFATTTAATSATTAAARRALRAAAGSAAGSAATTATARAAASAAARAAAGSAATAAARAAAGSAAPRPGAVR